MGYSLLGVKMTVNIIYDSRRPEYYTPLMETLKTQGISDYEIWPCLILPTVIESINLSHKLIIRDAKKKGLKRVCIWEQDCMIPDSDGWQHFMEVMPKSFDIYLGGTYGLNRYFKNPIEKINGLHCYILNDRFFDIFLSTPDNKHIDVALDGLGEYHVAYPFIALQRAGWSANSQADSNKNAELRDEDVYGGLPK